MTFYIKTLTEEILKPFNDDDDEVPTVVLEKSKPCRLKEAGKNFRWFGETLINDQGNFLTLKMSYLHEKSNVKLHQQLIGTSPDLCMLSHPYFQSDPTLVIELTSLQMDGWIWWVAHVIIESASVKSQNPYFMDFVFTAGLVLDLTKKIT